MDFLQELSTVSRRERVLSVQVMMIFAVPCPVMTDFLCFPYGIALQFSAVHVVSEETVDACDWPLSALPSVPAPSH